MNYAKPADNTIIPLYFSVPTGYSQTQPGGPILQTPSRVTFPINPAIKIPNGYSCYLTNASFCFSQPNVADVTDNIANISTGNNRISISYNGGALNDYEIPLGLYSVEDLQLALNQIGRDAGWIVNPTDLFILTGIQATQKVIMSLNPAALAGSVFPPSGIIVSFENPSPSSGLNNSMGGLLGFPTDSTVYSAPGGGSAIVNFDAPNVSNFANISAYNLYMSILTNSYQNGAIGQLLYSFPIGSYQPNSVVQFQPALKFPVPCQPNVYSTIDIWTTDQGGNPLPWKYYQAPFSVSCLLVKDKKY